MLNKIIKKYRLNNSQTKEFTEIISELQLSNKVFVIDDLLNFAPKSNKFSDEFMLYIRSIRFPMYSKHKEELQNLLHNINTKAIRVVYKDNFESNHLVLDIDTTKLADSSEVVTYLEDKKALLDSLIRLIKGV